MAVAVASPCDVPHPPLSNARVVKWTALLMSLVDVVLMPCFDQLQHETLSRAAGYRLYIEQGTSGITPPARANAGLSWSPTPEPADPGIPRSL